MPEAEPQITNLADAAIRRYDELKLELGALAQSAMLLCEKTRDEEGERALRQILARLAEDRFNLAVVGPFSRGKSSLMNAILGLEKLPTGLLPHTSVVTTVTYGPRERALVRCERWALAQEIPLDQLEEYVTERGNPGNRRRVAVAEIQLPVEILRRGLHFIDTPGVGSAIPANTEATEKFLPEIDAAIFVSSFDSVISENDIDFLRRLRATVGVVFLVLNKLDLVSDSQAEEVVRFVVERLESEPQIGRCALFSVSAKLALEAKRARDPEALARSGLPKLEAALAHFLDTDKTRQLARRVAERLIANLQSQRARAEIVLGASGSPEKRAKALHDLDERTVALKARLGEYAARLGVHAGDTLCALEARIDASFRSLRRTTLKKFMPGILTSRAYSGPGGFNGFAREVSDFCAQVLTREMRLYEAALNEDWQRRAGSLHAQMRSLPDQLFASSTSEDETREDLRAPLAEDANALNFDIGGVAAIDWRPQPPWWSYFVPARWFPGPAQERFAAILDRLLAEYRNQIEASVRRAMSQSIDGLKRETEKTLEQRAEHVRRSLLVAHAAQECEGFDELLQRAIKLRGELGNQEQRGLWPAEKACSENGVEISMPAGTAVSIRSCPVCRAIVEAVFENLSKLQYELSMDAGARQDHADDGGFCPTHTWIYSGLASPVGVSRAYPQLLGSLAAKLERAARSADSLGTLLGQVRDASPVRRSCPVCVLARRTAHRTIKEVLKGLRGANRKSEVPALCLPHVELALRCGTDLESGRLLTSACATALSRFADGMRRYALKHDAVRRDLVTADERDAAQGGLRKLVGEMLLVLPPREDNRF
jgi:small GTP-binding protein